MHVRPDHGSQCAMRGTTWMVFVSMAVSVTAVPKPIAVVCSDRWVGVRVSGPADRRRPPSHTCRQRLSTCIRPPVSMHDHSALAMARFTDGMMVVVVRKGGRSCCVYMHCTIGEFKRWHPCIDGSTKCHARRTNAHGGGARTNQLACGP